LLSGDLREINQKIKPRPGKINGARIMDQNINSLSVKRVFNQWQDLKRNWSEKINAFEKIKAARTDHARRFIMHMDHIDELGKKINSVTPSGIDSLSLNLKNLIDEGNTLAGLYEAALKEINSLSEGAEAAGTEINRVEMFVGTFIKKISGLW
jgi:uncharacterized coiled-coil DUF342 family protein